MPVTQAQLTEFVTAQAELDAYDAGRSSRLARRDTAAAVLDANMAVGQTVATVPTSPPVVRKSAEGTIEFVTHEYPGA